MAPAGKLRSVWVLVVLAACLLVTNAREVETLPDMEALCEDVECPVDCPSDSVLQSTAGEPDEAPLELDTGRDRRSIAKNNHPQESIKITPTGNGFVHQNQLQPHSFHRLGKRDVAEDPLAGPRILQDVCCPQRCTCRPCPTHSCPPHYVPIVDARGTLHQPGSCCPQVYCERERRCRSTNRPHETFGEGERWNEDPCTECRCEGGENRCLASFCKPLGCKNPITPPGQCCAVCDEKDSIFCPGHANCGLSCRHGFLREPSGCALCACSRKPTPTTTLLPTTVTEPVSTTTVDVSTTTPTTTSITSTTSTTTTARITTHEDSGATLEATWNSTTSFAEPRSDTDLPGTDEPEPSRDIPQRGNSSTHVPPPEINDTVIQHTIIKYFILFLAVAILVCLMICVCCYFKGMWKWSPVKKRHHGKYSTVPVSSTTPTPTTTTPTGTITASSTTKAVSSMV